MIDILLVVIGILVTVGLLLVLDAPMGGGKEPPWPPDEREQIRCDLEKQERAAELEKVAAEMASLIRFLRPDLTATRSRADAVLRDYETTR